MQKQSDFLFRFLKPRAIFCLFLLFSLLYNLSYSQGGVNHVESFDEVIEALEKQTYDHVQEKVYLLLDKPYYSKGITFGSKHIL